MPEPHPKKPRQKSESPINRNMQMGPSPQLDRMALLAHQLMTPLSTISTLAQGMKRRASRMTSDDVQDRSEKIWRASLRLQELIETILSYTRINAGALAPSLSVFNLDILVRRICQEYQKQEPSHCFRIDLKDLPDVFVGDPVLIEQSLAIVLSNAVKYSPAGGSVTIRSLRHKGQVIVEVADQGLGVPEADLPYLTQPFFRARNVKHVPGTGLGLSLVSHILKLHGGSVQINSREGSGTTLRLILPDEAPPEAGSEP